MCTLKISLLTSILSTSFLKKPMQALAPTRSRKQQPRNNTSTIWTAEEDALLKQLVESSHSRDTAVSWSAISKYFPDKTAPQLAGRWDKVLNPGLVKGSWTREEDETILHFIQENGQRDWSKLAMLLPGRTGKQCRERFKNHLDPKVHSSKWTEEEDQLLIDLHAQYGNAWTKLTTFFNGRTDNCLKNRWNSTLKKRLERKEKGLPLVLKRGRKPKGYVAPPAPEVISTEPTETESVCSSPIAHPAPVQMVPGIDLISMNERISIFTPKFTPRIVPLSLEENRLELQKMIGGVV